MKTIEQIRQEANIVPERLREARVSRAYTLVELGKKVGVSAQAISQYEIGTCKPSPIILNKIALELDFPVSFFQKNYYVSQNNIAQSAVYFRSYKSATKKTRESCKVKLKWINEIYMFTQEYIDYPPVALPRINDFLANTENGITEEQIEDISLYVRNEFGLGNSAINNLIEVLQDHGVVIVKFDFETEKVDAFSTWYNGIPYIVLGSDKKSACRLRFDLAHELGHLLLHNNIENEDLNNKNILDRIEKEADYFAGAFLLPQASFSKELYSTSLNQFILLKQKWKVSIAAMIKRTKNLGLINSDQESYLFRSLNNKGYRKLEPFDNEIVPENPYLFKQAIKLLLDNNVLTVEDIMSRISLKKDEIDSLLMLPPDLLMVNKIKSVKPVLKVL